MALLWRIRTSATISNTLQSACLVFTTSSPAATAFAFEGAVRQSASGSLSVPSCRKRGLALTDWPPACQLFMTTLRPPAGRVRHVRGSSAESDGDDERPSCSHANVVHPPSVIRLKQRQISPLLMTGARRSSGCGDGTYAGGAAPPGPVSRLPPSSQQPRRGSATAIRPPVAAMQPPASAAAREEGSTSLSTGSVHEEPQSDESHLSPYRSSQQLHSSGQQRDQNTGGHLLVMKSAKRRAAEALLAARLGGGSPAGYEGLQPFPNHALLAVRHACACCPGGEADAATATAASTGGHRHFYSSSAVPTDSQSTGTAVEGPDMPAAAATTTDRRSPDAANPAYVSSGLSALQQQVDSLAAATTDKVGAAASAPARTASAPAASVQGSGLDHMRSERGGGAAVAPEAVPRQAMQIPGPPPKRVRLSLSAAAVSSLGAGLSGAAHLQHSSAGGAAAAAAAAASTKVPPCDPSRGCKAQLREAAAAAAVAAARRRGTAAAAQGGDEAAGGGGESMPEAGPNTATAGATPRVSGSAVDPVWCGFEVALPPVNWQAVFDEPPGALQRFSIAKGYEKMVLPQGMVTYVVENERYIGDALRNLKAGMQDRLVAIDLEWRPETVSGRVSPVALLQLSSARVCVVVRTCSMAYRLPPELATFLADSREGHVLLGFGWDSADEAKMRGTFGLGRADFGRFLDLQEVAAGLGYHGFGLSRLSEKVLGVPLHKSKSISRSNWAAPQLTNHQLKYASLDVLVAGQLFRALRLWHSSPSPCADCRSPIGELLLPGPLRCGHPACATRPASSLHQHRDHCAATGHPARFAGCGTCGRLYELPAPAEICKS